MLMRGVIVRVVFCLLGLIRVRLEHEFIVFFNIWSKQLITEQR